MRKLVYGIIIIFTATFLTGCFNNNFDQNKIVSPEATNMSIYGTWKIENSDIVDNDIPKITEDSDLTDNIVTINKEEFNLANITIENPKFKLKRVKLDSYFSKNLKVSMDRMAGSTDEYVNIIDIYDDNKVYCNFIKGDNQESKNYIYMSGNLMEIVKYEERIEPVAFAAEKSSVSEVKISEIEKSNIINVNDKYYNMEAGVLLGLKKPSTINENDEIVEDSYRTLWISTTNGSINNVKELENFILAPRLNGFSKIELIANDSAYGHEEKLSIINNKQGEEETKKTLQERNVYNEINFVGNDYIGLQYYNGKNFDNKYQKFKVIPTDYINISESMDLVSLFGESVIEVYNTSKNNAQEEAKKRGSDFNLESDNYKNFTLQRKNGQWSVQSRINSNYSDSTFVDFNLNVSPIKSLVNYDGILIPWSKLKEFKPNIRDSVCAPNGKFIILLVEDELIVYKTSQNDNNVGKEIMRIPVDSSETIIMAEWATGEFVDYWNSIVMEYGANVIN